MTTRKEAMDKVRALLKLAKRAGTPGEAAAAASRAQAVLDRYEITRNEVEAAHDDEMGSTLHVDRGWIDTESTISEWRYLLIARLARFNGLAAFISRRGAGRAYEVSGRRGAIEAARMVYVWLNAETLRQSRRECRGMGRPYADSFRIGFVTMVLDRMELDRRLRFEHEREQAVNPAALMRVETALQRYAASQIAEQWMRDQPEVQVSERERKGVEVDPRAHAHGRIVGRAVDLTGGTEKIEGGVH